MKNTAIILSVLALLLILIPQSFAADAKRPMLLIFETNKGDGIDKDIASGATRAIRLYFEQSQRVDATVFNADLPTVKRAIMEHVFTADEITSYSSQADRVHVANTLGFDYVSGSEMNLKDGKVLIKLWVAQSGAAAKKNPQIWNSTGASSIAGTSPMDFDNAIQCAASAAVIDITRKAFVGLREVIEKQPLTGAETTAIAAGDAPVIKPVDPSQYVTNADQEMKSGNIALAIDEYSKAINADPKNGTLRIKLADAYAQKGLFDQAKDELNRAAAVGADAKQITDAKARVEQMQNRSNTDSALTSDSTTAANTTSSTAVSTNANTSTLPASTSQSQSSQPIPSGNGNAVTKIQEGDKLWSSGSPDEAADAYKAAIKLDPRDWRAYERLAVIDASMSLFNECLKIMDLLKVVQPGPSPQIIDNRYDMLRKAFDKHFITLTKQYDSNTASFEKQIISRESYYNTVKSLELRLESMAKLLESVTVPTVKQPANTHRSLACGLIAQAASSLQDYLETNNNESKTNAVTFRSQAKKEWETALGLDAGSGK